MIILVLNCGSSSLKYQLLEMASTPRLLCKGLVERIGEPMGRIEHKPQDGREKYSFEIPIENHDKGVSEMLKLLVDKEHGVLKDVEEISAIGHRVVHGGDLFASSVVITPEVEAQIEKCIELAPLHNPANLTGIRVMRKLLPKPPQVAVFDTAFHQTLEPKAYMYALPHEYYEKYRVRKYGFHGTSHQYVANRAAEILGKPVEQLKIITCHLGNGASMAAVNYGKSVDTSMGFTPVDGLVMGTRCGDVDPGALLFIAQKEDMNYDQLQNLINKKSGLAGVSGISNDMRDLENAIVEGNKWAELARDLFALRIRKYIGAYAAVMEGVDAIVFTGGIGENDIAIRKDVCEHLGYMGADFDENLNNVRGKEVLFSKESSKVKLMVVPTNEELMIARETEGILGSCGCHCEK